MPICPLCEASAYPAEAALADADLRSIPDSWLDTELEYATREAAEIQAKEDKEWYLAEEANRSIVAYWTHRIHHLLTEHDRRRMLAHYKAIPGNRIPPEKLLEIKERLPLERVIGQVLILKRSGNRLLGHCPFHEDWNPSLVVYPDGHWFCFQCQTGGDVFDWLMSGSSPLSSFAEAVKVAAQMAGVSLDNSKGGF
jgi:hypothetical protein